MNVEETYRATVSDNADPEQRGRIKVTSAQAMGAADAPLPMWIDPVTDWGWFLVPDVGEVVEIVMASHGDMDEMRGQTGLEEPDVRWRGTRFWTTPDAATPRDVPADFKTNYGKRRGFATPQGHLLMFDDTEGKEKVSLMWSGPRAGVPKFGMFSIDEDGSVIISNINGSLIYLNAADAQVTVIDEHGNSYTSDANGIRLIDLNGNIVDLASGGLQVIGQAALSLSSGGGTSIDGGSVLIGTPAAAIDFALLGTTFVTALSTFLGTMTTAMATWTGTPPLDPGAGPYLATMTAAVATFMAQLANVLSLKTRLE